MAKSKKISIARRNFLKASLAGLAGLTLPDLLRLRQQAAGQGASLPNGKSVILLWMTGGPSCKEPPPDCSPSAPR